MAGGEATLIRERTARPPPRFLLPRASGHRVLPALPPLPPHDLVLDGGIQPRFEGWADSTDLWRQWVAKLRPLHEPQWRELGIREGVLASTYRVRREGEGALLQLVPFWCSLTDTFVFPWGEATVTLEDVAALAGLPILGFPVREPPQPPELGRLDMWADACALQALRALLLMDRSKGTGTGGGGGWADYFLRQHQPKEPGSRAERHEHAAFLALWLARFVLPAPSSDPDSDIVSKEVIRIAVRMVHGHRAALAPAALASIYGDLSELHRHLIYSKRTEAPSVWAPMHILQLWVWERFPDLRPATAMATAGSIPDPAGGEEDVLPRAALWDNVHKAVDPGHARAVFMAPTTEFQWRPYGTSFWVRHGHGPLSFARCLKACELVGVDFVEQYSPHRVARQLGFDQDVPGTVTRLNTNLWETAWETYNIGEEDPFVFAIPSDMPGVTEEYAQWWKPYTVAVEGRDDDAMEIFDGLMNNNGDLMEDYSAETSKKGGSSGNNHGSSSGPKWAAGTLEMIQIASVNRQAGMAGSRDRVAKLLKEIQELAIDT